MTITIRPAQPADAENMSALLNQIIEIGGTTALLTPQTPEDLRDWMGKHGARASWHVAVDETGRILGQQSAEPHEKLPHDAADIASFVHIDAVGKGVGTSLFAATCTRIRTLGYTWLNASIRSDNASGLSYYTKMGFVDWKIEPDARIADGRITGKTHKRFDL